ncbi:MAG: hypothetical protein JW888_14895 [Pirellulales bacterium]|nr:hypothetical protein [Pirellulales bacterium]
MCPLHDLIGMEAGMPEVAQAVLSFAQSFDRPIAGTYHITCSDETEWECVEVFQHVLAEAMTSSLKPGRRAAFHTMNLGARYEPGAIHVAEGHYASPDVRETTKLMIVKINSHAAVRATPGNVEYGTLSRYGAESHCCGALAALIEGSALPAVEDLRQTFLAGGIDRIDMLRNARLISPVDQALFTAVANARLQAARAVADLAERRPASPTVFLVVPCVTINRATSDTELVVGQYDVDATEDSPTICYRGLGDVPLEYRLRHEDGRAILEDDQWPEKHV